MGERISFVLRLARREARSGFRRIGAYMASIAFGVGALVAIHSFRADVGAAIEDQAEILLGADVRLAANRPFPDSVQALVDSLSSQGVPVSHVTTAPSMVLAPSTETVRLLQVRGIRGAYPFYGDVETRPPGRWPLDSGSSEALVDDAVLTQLGVNLGDSLTIGTSTFEIVGSVSNLPTELGFQAAVGPRVYLSEQALDGAGLLGFGSLVRYETFVVLPEQAEQDALEARYAEVLRGAQVTWTTAREQARDLTRAVDDLGQFLGLVGLGALLLGGVGVASAIHVFVREKLTTVAVLRCLGARQWSVFNAYLLQAAALGLLGAIVGGIGGVAVQQVLPLILTGLLPVEVQPALSPVALVTGLATGVWVSVLFALIPLLTIRDVPPLRALRKDTEVGSARLDPVRLLAWSVLGLSVVGLSVLEAPEPRQGVAFAGGLAAVGVALWLTALGLTRATRRFFPKKASYTVRQGVSNLFRPQNQTLTITLALGFTVFAMGTVIQLQRSLTSELAFEAGPGRPNILLFDLQPDQVEGVMLLLPEPSREMASVDPIVPSRIAGVNGRSLEELRADTLGDQPRGWAVRREYRNTYREDTTGAETIVDGLWWSDLPEPSGAFEVGTSGNPARISVETGLAEELSVDVGDRVEWDVGGRIVVSEIVSLREVDWERLETNFFVVFEPGALEQDPHMSIVLTRIEDDEARSSFQRTLVQSYPNVSAIDITRVQEAVDQILGTVRRAIGFLAAFSTAAGLLVLAGALATSRYQRTREGALLKTLGARRSQVLQVLLTEYVALGAMAAMSGLLLSTLAAAALSRFFFDMPFVVSVGALLWIWLVVTSLTVVVGLIGSRPVLNRPPLPVLREATD